MAKNFLSAQAAYSWAVYEDDTIIGSRKTPPAKVRSFDEVRAAIRDLIGKGRLTGSVLVDGQRQPLDPEQFRDFKNMAIDEFGDIVPLLPHKRRDLPIEGKQAVFNEREFKSFFPTGTNPAVAWMRDYMARDPIAKGPAAVADCQKAIGATARAAKAAWRKISLDYGRGPGRRIKLPTA